MQIDNRVYAFLLVVYSKHHFRDITFWSCLATYLPVTLKQLWVAVEMSLHLGFPIYRMHESYNW